MSHYRIFVTCPDCGAGRHTDPCALRRATKAGIPLRCRSCAMKARYGNPEKIRARAKLLHSRGYSAREIVEHLADENVQVNRTAVSYWLSGAAA